MSMNRERGSALVIALLVLTTFGLVLGAVLSFAGSGSTSHVAILNQGRALYAADGGIDTAVARMRKDLEVGRVGSSCDYTSSEQVNGHLVTVECVPESDSGVEDPTIPRSAILATSTHGSEGIEVGSNNVLRVKGSVKSYSRIQTSAQSRLEVFGPIYATGACSGGVSSVGANPSRNCNLGTPPPGAIPVFEPDELAIIPRIAPSSCNTWIVRLSPGIYTDPAALSALTGPQCRDRVLHLEPGVYHFAFASGDWRINGDNVHVVGGTPRGWSPLAPSRPAAMPFGVDDPSCDPAAAGVQLVFSGESRINASNGTVELCPTLQQRISIYQRSESATSPYGRPVGCLVRRPYVPGGGSSCALISTSGVNTRLMVHGIVYAPSSPLDIQLQSSTRQILGRGIICRTLRIHPPSSFGGGDMLVSVPVGLRPRSVVLIARINGVERVRARVTFDDAGGDNPGETVTVNSWTVRR